MSSIISVVVAQDQFSERPFFSADQSLIVLDGEDDDNAQFVGLDNVPMSDWMTDATIDPYIVSLWTDSSVNEHKINAAIATVWSRRPPTTRKSTSQAFDEDLMVLSGEVLNFKLHLSESFFRCIYSPRGSPGQPQERKHLLNKWAILSLAKKPIEAQESLNRISLQEVAREYFAIISEHVKPFAFSVSEEYEDLLGGRVIDHYRENERISCIVSRERIQVLSYLGDAFFERVFDRCEEAKLFMLGYLESLPCGEKKEGEMETAKAH